MLIIHEKIGRCVGLAPHGSQIWSSQHNLWPLDGRAVALPCYVLFRYGSIHRATLR